MQVKESKGLVLKRDETKVRDIYKQGRMYFQQGEKIEAKNKKKRLWRHIDFEHPASFQAFSIRKEYYKKTGKAWKRAYLLYGPLGTGKSTMTAAMEKEDKSDLFSKKDGEKGKEDQNQSRVTLSGVLTSKMGYDRLVESLLREAKIAPPDVPGKLMARNHKIDVDASLKDLVQSLVRRKTYDTSHSDDHKKKPSGKKLRRPNGRDVKSVVAKARTRVAGSTAVPPLPPSHERLSDGFY
ncbi:hypothetical protein YC2023_052388 [Brassica napus]